MLRRMELDVVRRVLLLIAACMFCICSFSPASAQIPLPGGGGEMTPVPPGGGGGIKLLCQVPPGICPTKEFREEWAKKNNCQFPEDVCEKTNASDDRYGPKDKDEGFWGSLWDGVKGSVTYGYEFVKGVVAGLKGQLSDLWNMVTNPGEIISGLVALGQSFYDDPKGTMKALGEMLGQEAVNTFTRATQCGAYDLGKVIGSYVSPAFGLKLATNLTKFSGKLGDAAKALRKEYGCASFAAGTLVFTPNGLVPIETVAVGQQVGSRNEFSFADRPQSVTNVFGRLAPSYRRLVTEAEELKVTDEHPLWLQGKGWTEAHQLAPGDVIAGDGGDTMVLANVAVKQPVRVYNFSVEHTPNYFVGLSQIWAHNARICDLKIKAKRYDSLEPFERGFRAEFEVSVLMKNADFEPVGGTPRFKGNPQDDFAAWDGQTGIDGIYKNAAGDWVIIESKGTGALKKSDPEGCKGGMCKMVGGERQMSDVWIDERLGKILNPTELAEYKTAKAAGKVKKVYAITDAKGVTTTHSIIDIRPGDKDVKVGSPWDPKKGI
jgi:hypothetical protein